MVGSNNTRYLAGLITIVAAFVVITPLCGFLFDCGCTWPWLGLEGHCNIHDKQAVHQCPWCVSAIAGSVSVGLSVLVGLMLALQTCKKSHAMRDSALASAYTEPVIINVSKRVVKGLLGFVVVAVVSGWLSGMLQGYPYFVIVDKWPF